MDIGSIGAQFLNQPRNPFSSSQAPGVNSGEGFEDLLRRVQEANRPHEHIEDRPDTAFMPRASRLPPIDKSSQLYELCMELETILIRNMIRGMRNTIQRSNLIDTGFAGEIYEDMLWDEYASIFARNANLGFAEMAYRDLTGRR